MSPSRRATGEINILAMLDGQAPGRRLRALPAVVRYGAAGVLACSLIVALVWLVRGATPARDTGTADAAQASARLPQSTQPPQATRTTPDSRDTGNARDNLAVDVPGMRPALAVESPVSVPAPDMVASPAAPARGAVIIDLPQPAAAMESAMPARVPAGPETARAAARHAATHPASPSLPPARSQPAFRTNSSQALAHADTAPSRQKRAAAARTTSPSATVDTDVALISAILQHTGTRNEAADGAGTAACADKPCGPRMPPRQ
nr:hypothetical protein [Massilia sp. PDC64]